MTILGSSHEFSGGSARVERPSRFQAGGPRLRWYGTTLGLVFFLDQISKFLVAHTLDLSESIPVVGDVVRLTYVRNPGMAFSLLADASAPWLPWLFILINSLAILILTVIAIGQKQEGPKLLIPLGLIAGGAAGNLLDRLISGRVIDFIEISCPAFHWPVFNLADPAVVIGVVWLIGLLLFQHPKKTGRFI